MAGKHGRTDEQRIADLMQKQGSHLIWIGAWYGGKPRFSGSQVRGNVRRILRTEAGLPDGERLESSCGVLHCVKPSHTKILHQQSKSRKACVSVWEDRMGLILLAQKHGATLQEIGSVYGVSKQCIKQVIEAAK